MRTARTALIAGAAALGIAGLAGLALAAGPSVHEMTIRIPGGGLAQIEYTGNVAPKVMFSSGPSLPFAADYGFRDSPFAELDRISAAMDRQMDEMLQQVRSMQPLMFSGPLNQAVLRNMPAGASSYSFVSTMSGNGFCSRSVQIIASPDGGKPKVVSHSSGNCGADPGATMPSTTSADAPSNTLQTVSLKTVRPQPSARRGI